MQDSFDKTVKNHVSMMILSIFNTFCVADMSFTARFADLDPIRYKSFCRICLFLSWSKILIKNISLYASSQWHCRYAEYFRLPGVRNQSISQPVQCTKCKRTVGGGRRFPFRFSLFRHAMVAHSYPVGSI